MAHILMREAGKKRGSERKKKQLGYLRGSSQMEVSIEQSKVF